MKKGLLLERTLAKWGKFEQANRGTIFLDEIGELNLDLQAKLLRVLQNQEVQRVGGNEVLRVDVRVICATNRDIHALIKEGKFREDLYYRLFQFPIQLPPLRKRDQDAILLANHFREDFLRRHKDIKPRAFSAATRRLVLEYKWPGNVRQLKNAIERALLISDEEEIIPEDLMLDLTTLKETPSSAVPNGQSTEHEPVSHTPDAQEAVPSMYPKTPEEIMPLEELKRIAVLQAYKTCKGNVDQTSIRLGVTRSTIYRLLEKYKNDGFAIEV